MTSMLACDPNNPWLAYSVKIDKIIDEIPGVATYDLIFDDAQVAARYRYQPGQFNMLYLPGVGEVAISMSGNPHDQGRLCHTIREAGNVTYTLAQLKPGMSLGLRGPFGSSWPIDMCHGKEVILVAGGIGLAPLRPLVYEILRQRHRYGSFTLLHGARTPSGLLYAQEYDSWRASGLEVETTVDRAEAHWNGHVGVVTLLLDRLRLSRPEETMLLTCGPEIMMLFTAKTALAHRIPSSNIWLSFERHMNCAIGFCGHCQFGPTFVCKDGPVFRYDRIATLLQVEGL